MEPFMTEGIVIVTFLIGIFSCFGGSGLLIWVGGIGHCLVTNKSAKAGTMEGHGAETLLGLVTVGIVVDVLVGVVLPPLLVACGVSQLFAL